MKTQLLIVVQTLLKALGYYMGYIDGEEGVMTRNAVTHFKETNGLRARDFIGPVTLALLCSPQAKPAPKPTPRKDVNGVTEPPWLGEARNLLGTREVLGGGNNPTIMKWADDLDQWYPSDDVPWCGLFVAHCMAVGAPQEPQSFNRLGARAWRVFGEQCEPSIGAIGVFWRTHKTRSVNGHVAFIIGEDDTTYHILGGNQSDNVTITRITKSRLLECRAPSGWKGGKVLRSVIGGAVSQNET